MLLQDLFDFVQVLLGLDQALVEIPQKAKKPLRDHSCASCRLRAPDPVDSATSPMTV